MGNCIGTNVDRNELSNKFLNYNVIDKKYNIIVGTYFNKDEIGKPNIDKSNIDKSNVDKLNTVIYQGISIGYNNNEINKIRCGMIHRHGNVMVELYFENNIKLIVINENNNKLKMILSFNGSSIEKYIEPDVIKNYKLINVGSEYIDLLYDLINNEKN